MNSSRKWPAHVVESTRTDAGVVRWSAPGLTASVALELGILFALTLLFPYLIHLIPVPENAQLGARIIPMFYAPLLGTVWGRMQSALLVAISAPWLNFALTGHPSPPSAIMMTIQLLVFVLTLRLLLVRWGPKWYLACPAYLAGMAVSAAVAAIFPDLIRGRPVLPWLANSITMAWPGVLILLAMNWLALKFRPPGSGPAAIS